MATMDSMRIAENANHYILSLNGEVVRTFRKNTWTRRQVMIYRLGFMRGLHTRKFTEVR